MTDGVSQAFYESEYRDPVLPQKIWEIAKSIVANCIDHHMHMIVSSPQSYRSLIEKTYNESLSDEELDMLHIVLMKIKDEVIK